jgi:hypothetical protein
MTSAAVGADEAMPGARIRVTGRPAARPETGAAADPRARTSARERASHLRVVPDAATAAPAARPTRGGTARHRLDATTAAPAASTSRTAAFKKARSRAATAAGARVKVPGNPFRIVYRDAVDGWIFQGRTLSLVEVAQLQYAVPGDWAPFRIWCTVYTRSLGPFFAGVLDAAKFVLIHPVRGPIAGLGTAAAVIAPHLIH